MKNEITKINKNYYKIFAQPTCSIFLTEKLMNKVLPLLYKYKNELDALLQNNKDETIEEHWSLAYPNGKQESFYGTNNKPAERINTPKFDCIKVSQLYDIGENDIYSDDTKKEVEKLMELEVIIPQ